jgi:uncharacterized protein (TIGR02271 family)
MTTNQPDLSSWVGHTVIDRDGHKIGEIVDLYADDATGQPAWIAAKMGRSNVSFVPLAGATASGDNMQVPYSSSQVADAPNAAPDGHLSPDEEAQLYRHYGMDYRQDWSDSGPSEGEANDRNGGPSGGYDTSGPATDDAMTRSEEELRVGTERHETGRARLRKYVVAEQETHTIPVSREEVRIEREPISDDNAGEAMDGPAISEEEHEVVLHEERPVVRKEAVPKERVRLDTKTVTDERQVAGEVRKERIDADDVER